MRFAPCMLCCFTLLCCTDPPPVAVTQAPEPALAPETAESCVRVDVDGRITGSGIVVSSQGHVVTTTAAVSGYKDEVVTVGQARIKAAVIAIDGPHRLALLKAERPFSRVASLEPGPGPARDDPARLVGYVAVQSEPPMVERRSCAARINDPHYRGDSADALDLHDLIIVDVMSDVDGLKLEGAAVFAPRTGRVAGVVIGKLRSGGSSAPFMTMPSSTVRSFLASHGIRPLPAD